MERRATTAKLADDILDEFFASEDAIELKKNYKKKRAKFSQKNEMQHIESSEGQLGSQTSPSKQVKVSTTHKAAELVHRVAGVSGMQPGKKPKRLDEESSPDIEKAEHAKEIQYNYMADSSFLKQAMVDLTRLHEEVQEVVKELYHRKDLSSKVGAANDCYINLFQGVIAEMLRLQREKFQSQTHIVEHLRAENAALLQELEVHKHTIILLTTKHESVCLSNAEMATANEEYKLEINKLKESLRTAEDEAKTHEIAAKILDQRYQSQIIQMKSQTEYLINRRVDEERAIFEKKLQVSMIANHV